MLVLLLVGSSDVEAGVQEWSTGTWLVVTGATLSSDIVLVCT